MGNSTSSAKLNLRSRPDSLDHAASSCLHHWHILMLYWLKFFHVFRKPVKLDTCLNLTPCQYTCLFISLLPFLSALHFACTLHGKRLHPPGARL